MKNYEKTLSVLFLTACMCLLLSSPVLAATAANGLSTSSDDAVAAYQTFLASNKGSYDIVDIDEDGTPELMIHNTTVYKNQVYTYNGRSRKMECLVNSDLGRLFSSQIMYSVKKHQIVVPLADTRNMNYKFYKIKGNALKKAGNFNSFVSMGTIKDTINGKKVSRAIYNKKLKKKMKVFQNLRYTR